MSRSGERARGCPTRAGLALDLLEGGGRHSTHRSRCPSCARQWRALQDLESRLEATIEDVPVSKKDCPDAPEWAALADGVTSGRRRADLVQHLVECDACAALWAFLCRLPATEDRTDREGPDLVRESPVEEIEARVADGSGEPEAFPDMTGSGSASTARRDQAVRWGLRVAAVLTAGGILIWLAAPPPAVSPGGDVRLRGGEEVLVMEVVREEPGAVRRLRWSGGPSVDAYRLRLWNGAGDLLLERSLPPARREWSGLFPEADVLYWQVDGLRDGSVVARGPLRRLEGIGDRPGR